MSNKLSCSQYTAQAALAETSGLYARAENLMKRALFAADLSYEETSVVRQSILLDIAILNFAMDRKERAHGYQDEALRLMAPDVRDTKLKFCSLFSVKR